MNISVTLTYHKNVEGLGFGKFYFSLYPDSEITSGQPFNWIGVFDFQGIPIKVIIPQKSPNVDPKEMDFELDQRIPFTKIEIINKITQVLDKNYNK